jgi:hypothetical protein
VGGLLAQFRAAGIELSALPGGRVHALGPLTDPLRASIREHKAAILAELAANDERSNVATPEQGLELRNLLAIVAADWPDKDEALAVALADPEDALVCFRELARRMPDPFYEQTPGGPCSDAPLAQRDPRDDRRTCMDCADLTREGLCLAAYRGERPNNAARRDYHPIANALTRCTCYAPKPDEPDQRSGAERWPHIVEHFNKVCVEWSGRPPRGAT